MANPSKKKGSLFEREVCEYLRAYFPAVERRVLAGALDRGDVAGLPDWAVEVKATRDIDLAGALNEAEREANNAGAIWYAAIIKRRNRNIGQAYVTMPLYLWAELVRRFHDAT
jgi:hypothetical protein